MENNDSYLKNTKGGYVKYTIFYVKYNIKEFVKYYKSNELYHNTIFPLYQSHWKGYEQEYYFKVYGG